MPPIKVRDEGRVERLVSIAYILSTRSEIHIEELMERLGISKPQLESDLNVLMFCGLPPYSPEQLFDIIVEDDFVSMYFNDIFVAPLRLSKEEVTQILIALRRLEAGTSGSELENVKNTIAAFDLTESNSVVVDVAPSPFENELRESISRSCAVDMTYLSLNSASISNRLILPKRIFTTASTSYLFAIDQKSGELRVFRTDRILAMSAKPDITFEPDASEVPETAELNSDSGLVFIETKDNYVDLLVKDEAQWLLDTYPNEEVDLSKSIYRFYTPTAFFVARLLFANYPNVELSGGTFKKEAILEAMQLIRQTMANTHNEKVTDG